MNDQKQLIKVIVDLTKALNKNTDAIKENTELSKRDINTVESEVYNEPFLISPDQVSKIMNKGGVFINDGTYSGGWGSGLNGSVEIIPTENDPYKSVIDELNKLSGF